MKVSLLYRIFAIGISIVLVVIGILWKVEHSMLPSETRSEKAPDHSGFSEVEFESGTLVQKLKNEQEKRLHSYAGTPKKDATVQVPLERAIDSYLKKMPAQSREEAK